MTVVPFERPAPRTMLDHALAYAALGWKVFPVWGAKDGRCRCRRLCKSPGKHPVEHLVPRGQDDATTDDEIIRRWYAQMPEAGIAVHLAPSGFVAIDIDPRNGGFETMDDLEAQHGALAADVMQFTQGGGEHRVFKLSSNLQLPGKLGPGVDVKHNGYIVLAPTQGVLGKYDWEASSDPLDGSIPSPLPDWLRNLATTAVPAAPVATVASRYATEQQVAELRDALRSISSDDRDTWVRYGLALRQLGQVGYDVWAEWSKTSEKFDPVDQIRVWRSFKPGSVNFESIFFDAQKCGWVNPLAGGIIAEVVKSDPPAPAPVVHVQDVPQSFPVPVLNRIMQWMEGFSEEPNRIITMQGVLALASVLAGRIYESENGNVSSMYFLTLAPTGVGKGYPKEAIRRLLLESGCAHLMSGSGNTSAGAVFSALFKSPTHIQISDEFGKHLQAARRQVNGAMADAFAVMTEAYSDATGMLVPRNYSNFHLGKKELALLDTKIVQRPAITLYAFATPEQVFDNLSTVEIDDGFLNRLVAVDVKDGTLPEQRIGSKQVPQEFIDLAQAMRRPATGGNLAGQDTDYDIAPTPVVVPFSKDAWARFDQFKVAIRAGDWIAPKLTMRWRENAMRLATLLAVVENPAAPTISDELAGWSIKYITEHGTAFMRSAAANIADSDYHRLYVGISSRLADAGPAGMTERELVRKFRLFERTPPNLRDQVFAALVRDEVAVKRVFVGPSGRGKKREAWVGADFSAEGAENE